MDLEEDGPVVGGHDAPVDVEVQVQTATPAVLDVADPLDALAADFEGACDTPPVDLIRQPGAELGPDLLEVVAAEDSGEGLFADGLRLSSQPLAPEQCTPGDDADAEPQQPGPGLECAQRHEDRRGNRLPDDVMERELAGEPAGGEAQGGTPRARLHGEVRVVAEPCAPKSLK